MDTGKDLRPLYIPISTWDQAINLALQEKMPTTASPLVHTQRFMIFERIAASLLASPDRLLRVPVLLEPDLTSLEINLTVWDHPAKAFGGLIPRKQPCQQVLSFLKLIIRGQTILKVPMLLRQLQAKLLELVKEIKV